MTPEEKKQKINELQEKKALLYPKVRFALQFTQKLLQSYYQADEKWLNLKQRYESLDREEKLLSNELTMAKKKSVVKKPNKKKPIDAKVAALKALNNLSEEERRQIIANYAI